MWNAIRIAQDLNLCRKFYKHVKQMEYDNNEY